MAHPNDAVSPQLDRLIRPLVLVQRVIWAVITGSVVFYSAIVYVIAGYGGVPPSPAFQGLEAALYIAAAGAGAASVLYRLYALSDGRIRSELGKEADLAGLAENPRTKTVDTEMASLLESLSGFERKALVLMFVLQKITFINLFLNELIVVAGFVLAVLTNEPSRIIPFALSALVLCVWMYPRPGSLIGRARNIYIW